MKNLIVLLLLLTSCASAPFKWSDYDQGTATNDQVDRDLAACDMELQKFAVAGGHSHENQVRFLDNCLLTKGYKKKSVSKK